MEFSDKIQEDIMEHLTLDKLVEELKEKIREKDTKLQQKDEAHQVSLFFFSLSSI